MSFTKVSAAGIGSTGTVTLENLTVTGNVSVAGTISYEDVTNVDSVGLITARSGIIVSGGGGINLTGGAGISPPQTIVVKVLTSSLDLVQDLQLQVELITLS